MSTLKTVLRTAPKLGVELSSAIFEMSTFWQTISWYKATGYIKRGDNEPVMIMPGFTATDGSLIFLKMALSYMGYSPYTWEQGRNHGRYSELKPGILKKFFQIHEKHQSPVELLGWSKGGRMSLKLANELGSEFVSGVVTIGSPIWPNDRFSVDDIPEFLPEGLKEDIMAIIIEIRQPAPMPPKDIPYTAIHGSLDMIVPSASSVIPDDLLHNNAQNQFVNLCGHLGLGLSGRTVVEIIRHLNRDFGHFFDSQYEYA